MKIRFLTLQDVEQAHEAALVYGGLRGYSSRNLVESAVMRAQASFGGEYLYTFPWGMAAAYGHGIATNHGFSDANKRTAAVSMAVFLGLNGWDLIASNFDLEAAMLACATHRMTHDQLAAWLEASCHRRNRGRSA